MLSIAFGNFKTAKKPSRTDLRSFYSKPTLLGERRPSLNKSKRLYGYAEEPTTSIGESLRTHEKQRILDENLNLAYDTKGF